MSAASLVIGLPGVTVRIRSTVPAVTEVLSAIYRVGRDTGQVDLEYVVTNEGEDIVTHRDGLEVWRARGPAGIIGVYCHLFDAVVHLRDRHVLHAGATAFGHRAIVVLGESESGKSTMTALLAARGGTVLSDDVVPIGYRSGRCAPYPRRMFLRPDCVRRTPAVLQAITLLREIDTGGERLLTAEAQRIPAPRSRFLPVAFLFPRWAVEGDPFVVRRLASGLAAARLMDHSLNLRHAGHPVIRSCARLASLVPAYEVDVRDPAAAAEWAATLARHDERDIA